MPKSEETKSIWTDPQREEPQPTSTEEQNCGVWANVDFGYGPVLIRCTEVNQHENHVCHVEIAE
jgi:hypothetical protein